MAFSSLLPRLPGDLLFPGSTKWRTSPLSLSGTITLDPGSKTITTLKASAKDLQLSHTLVEQISKAIPEVEISFSSYDTAWVAMVPSPNATNYPCFPECIDWIMENQLPDGSWALPGTSPFLMKVVLSSTLACIIALERWNVGKEHVRSGLHFIESHFSFAIDERQYSPIGFNIIFPGMIKYAKELGLKLHISETALDALFHMRDLELKRGFKKNSDRWKANQAYIAEGLGCILDWKEVMKYQRSNGSLFNSPSATAAALTHHRDAKGFQYLHSVLHKSGNAVPTVYPFDIYTKLSIIDSLEKLGISHHFEDQIKIILDEIYRYWVENNEEIHLEIATSAIAFRILRMHGYDISSGVFDQLDEDNFLYNAMDKNFHNMTTVLELYKASQIKIFQNEKVMENLNSLSTCFLKQSISDCAMYSGLEKVIIKEMDNSLKCPSYAYLERMEHKKTIENYNFNNIMTLKTSYMFKNIDAKDIVELAVKDFNACQSIYQDEVKHLKRWVGESKLDQLEFARQKLAYCYFSAAATHFSPEMADVRMSWAKNAILTTVIDDFFDVGGSLEELTDFLQLVERWDKDYKKGCRSKKVDIIFSALFTTVNELGTKACALQGRSVTSHLIEIWLDVINSMMQEAEWTRNKSVPTHNLYMENGYVSFAMGPIILPALYFVGPKLPWDVVRSPEYNSLFKLVSICGRLLNDIQGFKREGKAGKLNSVSLRMLHRNGEISEEEAKMEIRSIVDTSRTELLRLVLQNEGSVVPRACKDLFWKMSKILHLFYASNDGFTSPAEMMSAVRGVIYEPLKVPNLSTSLNQK